MDSQASKEKRFVLNNRKVDYVFHVCSFWWLSMVQLFLSGVMANFRTVPIHVFSLGVTKWGMSGKMKDMFAAQRIKTI